MILIFIILFLVSLFLSRPIKNLFTKKPIEFDDSYMFSNFVYNDFLIPEDYILKHLLKDPGEVIEDDYLLPDFRFIQIATNIEFFVKTKYIEKITKTDFNWCDQQQFEAYKPIIEIPLFIVLGIGGAAHFPDKLYFIPFNQVSPNQLSEALIEKYQVNYNQSIDFSNYY